MDRLARPCRLAAHLLLVVAATACGDDDPAGEGSGGGWSTSTSTATVGGAGAAGGGGQGTGAGGSGGEGGAGGAGGDGTPPIDPRFAAVAEAVEQDLLAVGASGAAIAIVEGGQITFARGFGTRSADDATPVEASTLFRIGSVNKMLTAAALLTEVDRGTVHLEAPVTDVIAELELQDPAWAPSIRVHDLLVQTSGLRDFLVLDAPVTQHEDAALETFLTGATFRQQVWQMAPAGAFWNYSNPNYYLAGLTAELASGTPYRALVRERIFEPLAMNRTFFLADEVLADGDYALGASADFAAAVAPDTYENAWGRPAGYATSNVLDLARFAQFLLAGNEDVLSAELHAAMQSPLVSQELARDLVSYGYGLDVLSGFFVDGEFRGGVMVAHGGDIPGFAADVVLLPEAGFAMIALANADGAHLDRALDAALETIAPLPPIASPPDLSISDGELDAAVGTYQDDFNVGPMVVTRTGNELRVAMPLVEEAGIPYSRSLEHLAGTTFLLSIQGVVVPLTFIDGLYARTRSFVGVRDAPARPMAVAPAERRARLRAALATADRAPRIAPSLLRPRASGSRR